MKSMCMREKTKGEIVCYLGTEQIIVYSNHPFLFSFSSFYPSWRMTTMTIICHYPPLYTAGRNTQGFKYVCLDHMQELGIEHGGRIDTFRIKCTIRENAQDYIINNLCFCCKCEKDGKGKCTRKEVGSIALQISLVCNEETEKKGEEEEEEEEPIPSPVS